MTLTTANPPGNRPTSTLAKSISRWAIPPLFMILPAKIKKGMANKAKLSRPDAIRRAKVVKAGNESILTNMVNTPAKPML